MVIPPRSAADSPMNLTSEKSLHLVHPLPCPPELSDRFKRLPASPHEVVTRFDTGPRGDTIGTTWLGDDACLGSVSRGHGWAQQRGVLGYWRTPKDPAVALRVRFLKSGVDFSASQMHSVQHGPRVLTSWALAYDAGPFHPSFEKPPGDIFELTDLRVRISLEGNGGGNRSDR